jgi:hypothetical protein
MKINEPENLKTFAHIVDGKVVNVSVWDGETPWTPVEEIVEIVEGTTAGVGWDYDGKTFADNRPVINLSDE